MPQLNPFNYSTMVISFLLFFVVIWLITNKVILSNIKINKLARLFLVK